MATSRLSKCHPIKIVGYSIKLFRFLYHILTQRSLKAVYNQFNHRPRLLFRSDFSIQPLAFAISY